MSSPAKPRSVEHYAEITPDSPALWEDGRTLTFSEWNARSDRLAQVLAARAGVGTGDRVALCMQNRREWFIGQTAVAKLDASLVPVSPRLTPAEVHYIVADSAARAFLFDASDVDALSRVWTNEPASDKHSLARLEISFALAVDGPANEQKSDGDAAAWLPPNKSFQCQYVARQIAVKKKYHLWVTVSEKEAIKSALVSCPGQSLPAA